jgi:Asp-tRNA(Asn)/Glu-tRNA(Gln) amidotransferase A subunit family amidase
LSDELSWSPAWRLRELIEKRELSAVEVTEHVLGRVEELDSTLRCFHHLDREGAREQARRADLAVAESDELGPLHGVPVSVKAHIAVRGLPSVNGGVAPRDHVVVERLRRHGAVIFGTNVMPGMGTQNLRDKDGPTTDLSWHSRNPWDLTRVPGSSSAGGAAAVSAGVIPIAIGSDGGGSTRIPAAWTGIVGLHPTSGRVPWAQTNRTLRSQNATGTLGPLTRDVRDAALALQAMAGPYGGEMVSLQDTPPDFLVGIDGSAHGLRLAWTDDFGYARAYAGEESERVIDTVRSAAQGFRHLGAAVDTTHEVWADPWISILTTMNALEAPDEDFMAAQEARARLWDTFHRVLRDHDLLLSPTIQRVAFDIVRWNAAWTTNGTDYVQGNFAPTWTAHTFLFNWLGWPALSIPCGFVDGLPVGLQIIGRPNTEALVFQAANAFLRAFPRNERPPIS